MQSHVYLHAAGSREALQAAMALKRLDASVSFHMGCECTIDSKCSEALFALKRFLMGMDADVADEVAGFLKFFGAVRASMPADAIFLPDGA